MAVIISVVVVVDEIIIRHASFLDGLVVVVCSFVFNLIVLINL